MSKLSGRDHLTAYVLEPLQAPMTWREGFHIFVGYGPWPRDEEVLV